MLVLNESVGLPLHSRIKPSAKEPRQSSRGASHEEGGYAEGGLREKGHRTRTAAAVLVAMEWQDMTTGWGGILVLLPSLLCEGERCT